MTMPNSPISDVIADAFARFDATPRDLPQDAEELQKRIRFNPRLHPRMPDGRFAPKPGGKPHGDKLQPRGAKTKSKRFSSSRAAYAHALAHTQDTGESMYVIQRRKATKDHGPEWEVTPDKPKDTPIEVSYHKKPKDDTAAPKAGGGRTLDSGPSGDDDGDTVDLPMEHLKPASKPKSVSREERVSAYREQLRSSGMPSWAREAAVSQFREDLKLDEKLRADVDKQVERTPNVSDGGFGYKRYDSVRFDNGRGLGEQRGMVVGAKNDFSEPAIMVIDSEGNTQHVYPNEQKSTIGPMYAPNGFPWGDVSFDQVGKSITGVFEAACAELDRARAGILKDQMMTGDVPSTVDGPASGRKRKKKGPGDCGPDGAHVAKTKVAGYTRVVNGKVIHVSGYVTGGHAAIDAMAPDDILRRAGNPRNKTFNFTSRNDPPRGAGMGPNFQTDAEFGRDRPKKPNPGRKSNLERIIAESKDKDQVAAATAELERNRHRRQRSVGRRSAAGGSKFTSVKPGEEKVIDGVTIRRSKAIGRMGSTYTLSTPHIGQVVYGRKQGQAKAEHEYLVAHDGGAKKDPKYTWQAAYEIGDVLEDGSVVKAFWRNELIVKRPDGSKGSHSALSTLPKKKSK